MPTPPMTGEQFREIREARGLTQQQMAALLEAGESTVRHWEHERRKIPPLVAREMRRIARGRT